MLTPKRNWRQCWCKVLGRQTKSIMVCYGIFWSGQLLCSYIMPFCTTTTWKDKMSQHGLRGNKLYCIYLNSEAVSSLQLPLIFKFTIFTLPIIHLLVIYPPPPASPWKPRERFFQMSSYAHVRVKTTKGKFPGEYITWSEFGKPNIQAWKVVLQRTSRNDGF